MYVPEDSPGANNPYSLELRVKVQRSNSVSNDFARWCDGVGVFDGVFVFSVCGSLVPACMLTCVDPGDTATRPEGPDITEALVVVLDNGSVNKVLVRIWVDGPPASGQK